MMKFENNNIFSHLTPFRICIIGFIIFQIWTLFLIMNYPYTGVSVKEDAQGQWVVRQVYSSENAELVTGLQIGDIILKANNIPANQYDSIVRWRTLDKIESVEFSRNGQILTFQRGPSNLSFMYDVLPLFGSIISSALGYVLYRNYGKSSRSSQILSFVFIDIAMICTLLSSSVRGEVFGKALISCGIMLLPVILMHFLVVLLSERGGIRVGGGKFKLPYAIILSVSVIHLILQISAVPHSYDLYMVIGKLSTWVFIIGIIWFYLYLVTMYVRSKRSNSYVTAIIKTIWLSSFLSFSPFVFLSLIPMLSGREWISSFYTSFFVLLFPLSFTYLIISKKLYDVDIIVRRIMFSVILSILPSALITGLFSLLSHEALIRSLFFVFSVCVIFMSLIFYWFEYLSVLLERFVFPRKYLLQKLLNKISQELQTITSFQDLRMIMLRDVVQALRVYGGAVLVVHQDREPEIISEGEIEAQALLDWDGNSEDSKQLDYTRLEITRNEEYECYLFLTRKSSNTVLTMEEVRWLRIIVSYLSVSMENLFLTRKLRQRFQYMAAALPDQDEAQEVQWFRKLMIELQEDERYRIASDLHDTTMQDLFFLKRKVSNLFNEYTKHPEDQRKLESLLNYVEIINMNLRQSFFELHPMLIREVGLIQTMKKAFREDMVNQSFTVELKVDQEERIEEESLDVKRHLFRIVQELLSNAKKHSEARRVEFTLSVSPEGWLILKYKDDGVGMEQTTRRPENPLRSGIGLEQMKSRVIYMGGQFELHTSPGRGMRVVIEIPLQSQLTA